MFSGSQNETGSHAGERRLRRAKEHVLKRWFPVNTGMLEKIRCGLNEGAYDLDLDFLIVDIKADFSLFTQCLGRLTAMLRDEGAALPADMNPISVFQCAGIERIRRVICDEIPAAGEHSFETMSEAQFARLQQAMVSASTAEVLSEQQNIHPHLGYSVGLLRQLGLTLIAWNYPKTYSRALAQQNDLELELSRALGFSPALLAESLVREWGLGEDICGAVGDSPPGAAGAGMSQVGLRLQKICQIGEALARANDPEHYPEARSAWESVRRQLISVLGSDSLKLIQQRVQENCAAYVSNYPELFQGIEELDPVKRLVPEERAGAALRNPWIKCCSPRLKRQLIELYERLGTHEIDRDAVSYLVKELIPLGGFTGGCIYVIDPSSGMLMPRVKIGLPRLLSCVPLPSKPEERDDESPIHAAFACSAPIMETALPGSSGLLSYIAASFGGSRKVGVLYLEMPDVSLRATDPSRLQRFKALLQALNDCLHLR